MKLFIPITKVDVAKREVWGRAAQEVADKAGEIMDYATSKPHFENWSAEFERVTDGQSLGNLRAMHGKVAAGKLVAMLCNDHEKAFDIGTKVVDDQEWEKVMEGVYTGFSVGGKYEKKWADGELTRYTANPHEISLVDSPCIPTARFSLVKADGTVEERAFAKREFSEEERQKAAEEGEAMPDGSFPIKTKEDLKNAISAYGRAKDKEKAKAHIIARAKALDATDELPDDWDGSSKEKDDDGEKVKKGMYTIAHLAALLQDIDYLASETEFETRVEGDMSPIPDELHAWCESGCAILRALVDEETRELTAEKLAKAGARHSKDDFNHVQAIHGHIVELGAHHHVEEDKGEKAVPAGELAKAGARHIDEYFNHVQAVHEHVVELGADCHVEEDKGEKAHQTGELAKAAGELAKVTADNETLKKVNEGLAKRVVELEKQPAPAKVKLKTVEKAEDLGGRATEKNNEAEPQADEIKKDDPAAALAAMKKAQQDPKLIKV